MHDIFFISYQEPEADLNWEHLKNRMFHARRVHGIKGIHNAHRRCAKLSFTKMFWTVDGDTVVDDFDVFYYKPPVYDQEYLHVWRSKNPVNDLAYGYGSIKLWPRAAVLDFNSSWLDFTTTVGNMKLMHQVPATTRYNTSAYEAWKSAFRECIKLCNNIARGDAGESRQRLDTWLTKANTVPFADSVLQGAADAVEYFENSDGDQSALQMINDFDWLMERYHGRV